MVGKQRQLIRQTYRIVESKNQNSKKKNKIKRKNIQNQETFSGYYSVFLNKKIDYVNIILSKRLKQAIQMPVTNFMFFILVLDARAFNSHHRLFVCTYCVSIYGFCECVYVCYIRIQHNELVNVKCMLGAVSQFILLFDFRSHKNRKIGFLWFSSVVWLTYSLVACTE